MKKVYYFNDGARIEITLAEYANTYDYYVEEYDIKGNLMPCLEIDYNGKTESTSGCYYNALSDIVDDYRLSDETLNDFRKFFNDYVK